MNERDYERTIARITLLESLLADARALAVNERYAEQFEDLPGLDRPNNPRVMDKYQDAWNELMEFFGNFRTNELPKDVETAVRKLMDATQPATLEEALKLIRVIEAYQIPF